MERAPRETPETARQPEDEPLQPELTHEQALEQLPEAGSAEWEKRFERDPKLLAEQVAALEEGNDRKKYEDLLAKAAGTATPAEESPEIKAQQQYEKARSRRSARLKHDVNRLFMILLAILALILAIVIVQH